MNLWERKKEKLTSLRKKPMEGGRERERGGEERGRERERERERERLSINKKTSCCVLHFY